MATAVEPLRFWGIHPLGTEILRLFFLSMKQMLITKAQSLRMPFPRMYFILIEVQQLWHIYGVPCGTSIYVDKA